MAPGVSCRGQSAEPLGSDAARRLGQAGNLAALLGRPVREHRVEFLAVAQLGAKLLLDVLANDGVLEYCGRSKWA